jgi:hypothetical protein
MAFNMRVKTHFLRHMEEVYLRELDDRMGVEGREREASGMTLTKVRIIENGVLNSVWDILNLDDTEILDSDNQQARELFLD